MINCPNNDKNGGLIVFQFSSNSTMQMYVTAGGYVYLRMNWAAGTLNWSSWTLLINI